jgi:primary-amine oxidase
MVQVQYLDGNQNQIAEFGRGMPMCSVDVEAMVPDLETYVGDEVVRKFPYDPNDLYFETDSIE